MHNAVSILTPKRDRPSLHSFSIRDLFLVTMIVALAVGWWVDKRRIVSLERERNEAKDDATWLANQWQNPFINGEVAVRTEEILKKYDALPKSSEPAPNPPKP